MTNEDLSEIIKLYNFSDFTRNSSTPTPVYLERDGDIILHSIMLELSRSNVTSDQTTLLEAQYLACPY